MGSSYEAIGPAENIMVPDEKKVGINVEQTEQNTEDKKETRFGKCGWSVEAMILMSVFMPLIMAFFFAAGIGFGKIWKSN